MKSNEMNIVQRVKAPTPKFFKVLRTIGLALATVGGTIIASPIALPAGIVAAAELAMVMKSKLNRVPRR